MKRIFSSFALVAAALSLSFSLTARPLTVTPDSTVFRENEAFSLIKDNPYRAANVYHSYEHSDLTDTKAPAGYKPFYISHYGRHGSRYHLSMVYFERAQEGLHAADEAHLLTDTGKQLEADVDSVVARHQMMWGMLTQKGGQEHTMIARRMFERFPHVFHQRDRRDVRSISSTELRCAVSMSNFCSEIARKAPKMVIHFDSGDKYMTYIAHDIDTEQMHKDNEVFCDSLQRTLFDPERIKKEIFTDPEAAREYIPSKSFQKFFKSVYLTGSICDDLDGPLIDIFRYFSPGELYAIWYSYNARMYGNHCNSAEYGDYRCNSAKPLLRHIIQDADEAIADGKTAADLRFGHDTGLLPLINLMRLEGQDTFRTMAESSRYWYGFQAMPMGANIQLVFYRNHRGDILVKILYEEKESVIPALPTFKGPYYRWTDLREYLMKMAS